MVAHQRRRSAWWRSTGFWGWWDGLDLRGIVSLGSVTATEFMIGLRRHGDVCLGPIEIENIRTEVYAAVMSISVGPGPQGTGRYQPFKIAIEPVAIAARTKPIIGNIVIEPLPIIF